GLLFCGLMGWGLSKVSNCVCVMMNQPGFKTNEISTKAVANDSMRCFQFKTDDQLKLHENLEQNQMSENTNERFAANLHLLQNDHTNSRQTDQCAIRTKQCPNSLQELRQPHRNPIDKGNDPNLTQQSIKQLAGNIDNKPS